MPNAWRTRSDGRGPRSGMLDEMGFRPRFPLLPKGRRSLRSDLDRLAASLGASRHAVLSFRDREGLTGHLRSGRVSIVFSNVRHDTPPDAQRGDGVFLNDLRWGSPVPCAPSSGWHALRGAVLPREREPPEA